MRRETSLALFMHTIYFGYDSLKLAAREDKYRDR